MAENPLLPHRKLRELHALMLHCRALERKRRSRGAPSGRASLTREALLAATTIHLLPGDLLSAAAKDEIARQLSPEVKKPGTSGSLLAASPLRLPGAARLPLCAAAARGLQAGGTDGIVLVFVQAGAAETQWKATLEWAQQLALPLLIACADATDGVGARPTQRGGSALNFITMNRLAKRLKLPVLTVDGEDAVAVYRVMQESVLRARIGGGPAILWAAMTPVAGGARKMPRSSQPIARLESYMAARGIALYS